MKKMPISIAILIGAMYGAQTVWFICFDTTA